MKRPNSKKAKKTYSIKSELRYQKRVDAVSAVHRGDEPKVVARLYNIPIMTKYDWLARYL